MNDVSYHLSHSYKFYLILYNLDEEKKYSLAIFGNYRKKMF